MSTSRRPIQTAIWRLLTRKRGFAPLLQHMRTSVGLSTPVNRVIILDPLHNRHAARSLRLSLFACSILIGGGVLFGITARTLAQTPVTYYVDCDAGSDGNPGTSTAQAWKSINKVNNAALNPGDSLLFKRGCSWQGPLRAGWVGTAAQPITIGAYGTGDLPKIRDSYSGNVQITGSYLVVEYIETTLTTPPNPDPNCSNQPVAWKVGFALGANSSYNTIQHVRAGNLAVGIYLDYTSHHNKVLYSELVNNHVVWKLAQNQALGAMGILLHGDYNEIAYNTFADNRTICTYNGIVESNSIELHGARYANIHHNVSFNDRVFSELGSSTTYVSTDNVYAYNLHVVGPQPSAIGSRFLVTRGDDHANGPVWRTVAYNNTIYHTGADSKGITCQTCGNDVLTVKNNLLWVDREPISSDGPFIEEYNLFWATDGNPLINFVPSQTSQIANPQFVDLAAQNFRLQATSPARQAGDIASVTAGYTQDLDQVSVPQGNAVDIGAYEFVESDGGTPEPTPTPTPDPTPVVDCAISINDGALYTGLSAVRVKATVNNGAQMMISNDAGFTGATWQTYQSEFDWLLRDTDGRIATLVVYMRVADGVQTPLCGSGHVSDDIIYDPVAPTVAVALGTAAQAAAAPQTTHAVTLHIAAEDQENGSGVAQMQVSLDPSFVGEAWQPFTTVAAVDAAPGQTIHVRVQDGAGNTSTAAAVTVPNVQTAAGNRIFVPFVAP